VPHARALFACFNRDLGGGPPWRHCRRNLQIVNNFRRAERHTLIYTVGSRCTTRALGAHRHIFSTEKSHARSRLFDAVRGFKIAFCRSARLLSRHARLLSNRIEGFGRSCLIPDLSRRSGNRFAGGTGVPVAASKKELQIEFFPETGYITRTPARRICGAGTGEMYLPAEARERLSKGWNLRGFYGTRGRAG